MFSKKKAATTENPITVGQEESGTVHGIIGEISLGTHGRSVFHGSTTKDTIEFRAAGAIYFLSADGILDRDVAYVVSYPLYIEQAVKAAQARQCVTIDWKERSGDKVVTTLTFHYVCKEPHPIDA
jgi:hypothetical protein